MKGFKKLALVSAVAALPMTGFAMEPMDDASLSDVTGQDGISIGLTLNQTMDVLIHDTDGLTGVNAALVPAGFGATSGGIYIDNMGLNGTVTVDVDAGGNTAGGAGVGVLVVEIGLGAGFQILTGDILAVDTEDAPVWPAVPVNDSASADVILDSMTIDLAAGMDLGLQLGTGAADFVTIINGNIGTITINNFCLSSNDSCGGLGTSTGIGVDVIAVSGVDLGGTTVDLTTGGMQITLGASMNSIGLAMDNVSLDGGENSIGDVYITGLNMAGDVITINGK